MYYFLFNSFKNLSTEDKILKKIKLCKNRLKKVLKEHR